MHQFVASLDKTRFLIPAICIHSFFHHTFRISCIGCMKASKAQVIEIERYCDEHGISRQQRISELGLSPLIFLFLKCVIQLHYVYRPVSPVIEMTTQVDLPGLAQSDSPGAVIGEDVPDHTPALLNVLVRRPSRPRSHVRR